MGLNVSPLIGRYRPANGQHFVLEMAGEMVRYVLENTDLGVLLIPHVTSRPAWDDYLFMRPIFEQVKNCPRVKLMPPQYDAAQTKYAISQCEMLVAARTHATIAGFSAGVPTLSLGYSQKALGLNRDIFGDNRYLVDVRSVRDVREPLAALQRLQEEREAVRRHLQSQRPIFVQQAEAGSEYLAELIRGNQ